MTDIDEAIRTYLLAIEIEGTSPRTVARAEDALGVLVSVDDSAARLSLRESWELSEASTACRHRVR
jgi:hypothetical protein